MYSSLHILTDLIWGVKCQIAANRAKDCWQGTFYYGGGPCVAIFP
jgi:hypothetical protein